MSDLHDDWRLHFATDAQIQRDQQRAALVRWLDQRDNCHVSGWIGSLTAHDRAFLARLKVEVR